MEKRAESDSLLPVWRKRCTRPTRDQSDKSQKGWKPLSQWRGELRSSLSVGNYSPLRSSVAGSCSFYPSRENKLFLANVLWQIFCMYEPSCISLMLNVRSYDIDNISLDDYLVLLSQSVKKFLDSKINLYATKKGNRLNSMTLERVMNHYYDLPCDQRGVYLSFLLPGKYVTNRNKSFKAVIPFMEAVALIGYYLPTMTDMDRDYLFESEYGDGEENFHKSIIALNKEMKEYEKKGIDSEDFFDRYADGMYDYQEMSYISYVSEHGINIVGEIEAYKNYRKEQDHISKVQWKICERIRECDFGKDTEKVADIIDDIYERLKKAKCPQHLNNLKDLVSFEMVQKQLLKTIDELRSNRRRLLEWISIGNFSFAKTDEEREQLQNFYTETARHHVIFFTEHSYTDCLLNSMYQRLEQGDSTFDIGQERHSISFDKNLNITETKENVEINKFFRHVSKSLELVIENLFDNLYASFK